MDEKERQEKEVKRNYAIFRAQLPALLDKHRDQIALMRDGKIVAYYPSMDEAAPAAREQFPDGIYSFQTVTDEPMDFGWFSHAPL